MMTGLTTLEVQRSFAAFTSGYQLLSLSLSLSQVRVGIKIESSLYWSHVDMMKKKEKNYSTEYSHVVPHHSTDSAINYLTAQIGRDAVLLVVYGRNSKFT
jgi:hypothetical protein